MSFVNEIESKFREHLVDEIRKHNDASTKESKDFQRAADRWEELAQILGKITSLLLI